MSSVGNKWFSYEGGRPRPSRRGWSRLGRMVDREWTAGMVCVTVIVWRPIPLGLTAERGSLQYPRPKGAQNRREGADQ